MTKTKALWNWRRQYLFDVHRQFTPGNPEDRASAFMARNNHPRAQHYKDVRDLWDALPVFSGRDEKVVAFRDCLNRVVWRSPALTVTDDPTGSLQQFRPVREGDNYDAYLRAAAAANWPQEECSPGVDHGTMLIVTQDYLMVTQLFKEDRGQVRIQRDRRLRRGFDASPRGEEDCWFVTLDAHDEFCPEIAPHRLDTTQASHPPWRIVDALNIVKKRLGIYLVVGADYETPAEITTAVR